jgi:hypothetical protein
MRVLVTGAASGNAGINRPAGRLVDYDPGDWDRMFAVTRAPPSSWRGRPIPPSGSPAAPSWPWC